MCVLLTEIFVDVRKKRNTETDSVGIMLSYFITAIIRAADTLIQTVSTTALRFSGIGQYFFRLVTLEAYITVIFITVGYITNP
jgi:hypothetical protein